MVQEAEALLDRYLTREVILYKDGAVFYIFGAGATITERLAIK